MDTGRSHRQDCPKRLTKRRACHRPLAVPRRPARHSPANFTGAAEAFVDRQAPAEGDSTLNASQMSPPGQAGTRIFRAGPVRGRDGWSSPRQGAGDVSSPCLDQRTRCRQRRAFRPPSKACRDTMMMITASHAHRQATAHARRTRRPEQAPFGRRLAANIGFREVRGKRPKRGEDSSNAIEGRVCDPKTVSQGSR